MKGTQTKSSKRCSIELSWEETGINPEKKTVDDECGCKERVGRKRKSGRVHNQRELQEDFYSSLPPLSDLPLFPLKQSSFGPVQSNPRD